MEVWMHPAQILDRVVSKTSKLPPIILAVVRPILYPFIMWRMKGIATTLATKCRWLPATSWEDIEKHGQNVVYCTQEKTDVFSKLKKVIGVWVVDYKNNTVRTVFDVPEQYRKTGATF